MKGPSPGPSGLGAPWPIPGRGPPSAAARSRASTRRGLPSGPPPRRRHAGPPDVPSTRAAAAARVAMLQQRRGNYLRFRIKSLGFGIYGLWFTFTRCVSQESLAQLQ